MNFTTIQNNFDNVVTFTGKAFNGLSRFIVNVGSTVLDSSINPELFTLPTIPDPLPDTEPTSISITIKLPASKLVPGIYIGSSYTAYKSATLLWTESVNILVSGFLLVGTNSYCTLVEADDYHSTRFGNESWFSIPSAERERLLVGACNILETINWLGDKSDYNQNLEWPRITTFPRTFYRTQQDFQDLNQPLQTIEQIEMPKDIKYGQSELAFQLSTGFISNSGVSRVKVGSITVDKPNTGILPINVKNLVDGFINKQARLIRT